MENDNKQQLDIACERLRMMIRNERQVIDYKDAWRKMALTSSNKSKTRRYDRCLKSKY